MNDRPAHGHHHGHHHHHGHLDPEVLRTRVGIRAVALSLVVLGVTALLQLVIFWLSGSIALLADLIHNFGDALTAIPLAVAFLIRSRLAERWAGRAIVAVIFVSAVIAGFEAVQRLITPHHPTHLFVLGCAGAIGVLGNEIAAQLRLRGGRATGSAALIADGKHARVDGIASFGVIDSAVAVAFGIQIADPLIGLVITAVLLKIAGDSWRIIRADAATHSHT